MRENGEQQKASLLEMYLTFAKVGLMTFGGGYAMLPILQREVVEKKRWASNEDLANYFAIGQCTPGIIAVNTTTFIGHKYGGALGAIIATLGVVTPSVIVITALAGVITRFSENIYVQKAFMGIRVCVAVLVVNAIVKLWKSAIDGKVTLAFFLAVLLAAVFLPISPVLIVVIVVAFGILFELLYARRAAG